MNENMNRFDFNTKGKICDYDCEEPKVLSEGEILEELNRLDQANYGLSSECTSVNWTNECLQEQVDILEKALELACEKLAYKWCFQMGEDAFCGDCKPCLVDYFKEQAKEMMKSETTK